MTQDHDIPDLPVHLKSLQEEDPGLLRVSREEARQLVRLPDGYKPNALSTSPFDPKLAYELALGIDSAAEIFERYGYTQEQALKLANTPTFQRVLQEFKKEVVENGLSFKLKARIQAEDLLTHSYDMATDPEVPASVRAKLIEWTARMAELEPKEAGMGGAAKGGGGFTLNIMFAGGQQMQVTAEQPQGRIIEHDA